MNKQFRQGDVLIEEISKDKLKGLFVKATVKGKIVLAEGEVTGHLHAIEDVDNVTLLEPNEKKLDWQTRRTIQEEVGDMVLQVDKTVELRHPEHDSIKLGPGLYAVRRQREWVGGRFAQSSRVQD